MSDMEMIPVIEIASSIDIPALTTLEQICFSQDRLSAKQFRYLIAQQTALVVTMRLDKSVAGSAVVLFRRNSDIARLYSFALDPNFRGKGWAKILYDFVEHDIRSRHCKEVRLEVRLDNEGAIQFYKKRGFILFGKYNHFYEDGQHALRMRKVF